MPLMGRVDRRAPFVTTRILRKICRFILFFCGDVEGNGFEIDYDRTVGDLCEHQAAHRGLSTSRQLIA